MFNSSPYKFKFNLGYSGYYYQHGNIDENLGDKLLMGILLFAIYTMGYKGRTTTHGFRATASINLI